MDAIFNFSNCSRVTTCHQAVSENRDPWLPKSTVKKLYARLRGEMAVGSQTILIYYVFELNITFNIIL